jgi:hypothetical protein
MNGTFAYDVHRDCNSFVFDSVYADRMLSQDNPNIGDSMRRLTDTIIGSALE